MRWTFLLPLALLLLSTLLSGCFSGDDDELATVTFTSGEEVLLTVSCEVASTEEEKSRGLMNRDHLDPGCGMLFVYDVPKEVTFWMKDTTIYLDIIFVAADGYVLSIHEADPEIDTPDDMLRRYHSRGKVGWVVEINQGLCKDNGITAGARMEVLSG